ncbi:hypothetical protein [Sphingomonas sp.]|uniref:hypothetical protein n=1 Tax=Sphingomonas sp. TaxID=28214 RepID=UPI002DBCD7D3|nr:hypothetical protein [Sphingomonas sp.]HEU4969621.1 hypothetical protein [Sphingomonas sp.]
MIHRIIALILSCGLTISCQDETSSAQPATSDDFVPLSISRAKIPENEVCMAEAPEMRELQTLFERSGWSVKLMGSKPCPVLVHFNEVYQEYPSLSARDLRVFKSGKCMFDAFMAPNGSIYLLRAAAIRSKPRSYENCALRALNALEGRIAALEVPDEVLAKRGAASPEQTLRALLTSVKAVR